MNLWDHLGELRRRLLICIYVLLAGLPIGAFAVNPVIAWLSRPVGELVFVQPMEAFTAQLEIAVGVSFLIGLPVILYQVWAFVAAGLSEKEKGYFRWMIPIAYGCFMIGVAFSTFWVFPRAVLFLLTLKSRHLVPMLSVEAYLKFFMLLGLAFGLLFELPLVLHLLAKLGILREDLLTGHRKVCYFLIFLAATLFNPVPEVLTQLVLAGAAIALFEISIMLVRWESRKKDAPASKKFCGRPRALCYNTQTFRGDNKQMATISMKALLEAGVHFGHQTRRWNPKMAKYIFGSRSNIHIIDLQKTAKELKKAYKFIRDMATQGRPILFVGTKKQAQEAIVTESQRCGSFYVSERWLGGTLTNFETIKRSIGRLTELDKMKADGLFRVMSKKEVSRLEKERLRLTKTLSGFKGMHDLPGCLFVIDPVQENTAILEARRMEIPVVAVCDTNCDPDLIDYPVPGNDDAIRSVKLFCTLIADAILEGKAEAEKAATPTPASAAEGAEQATSETPIELSASEAQAAPAAEEPITPSSSH